MTKGKVRHCNYCKKITECGHSYTNKTGIYQEKLCECLSTEGISFNSVRTSIHQDCFIEMMEKVMDSIDTFIKISKS